MSSPESPASSQSTLPATPGEGAESTKSGASRSALKITFQLAGFAVGLGLLVYVISIALKKENREQLSHLASASVWQLVGLFGLSIITVTISGAVFRETLAPVRKLKALDVQATNFIACLLALVPFKLSVLFRLLVHNRRDGVPIVTIGAWFAAVGAIMGAILGPILLVSLIHPRGDGLWLTACLVLIAICFIAMVTIARFCSAPARWAWLTGWWTKLPLPHALRTPTILERAREGLLMLGHPKAVGICGGLRLLDTFVQAARFMIAASILGLPLKWGEAVLAGGAYFFIGALAPTGQLGTREAGTAKFMSELFPTLPFQTLAVIVLVVTSAEALVLLMGGMISVAWLRPDRLLRLGRKKEPALRVSEQWQAELGDRKFESSKTLIDQDRHR